MRKIIFPILMGVAGCAVLIWLGTWQVKRLDWKEGILAEIDSRRAQAAVPLAFDMTEDQDEYRPVIVTGTPSGDELHVLASGTAAGTGYRVISAFTQTDGTRVLVDLGLLPLDGKDLPPVTHQMDIAGTLLWPDDQNKNTPEPDLGANIWFARNVATMAAHLDTAPYLVVASTMRPADTRVTPLPVTTANIKNDHLEYAITWFLLAAVWAIMSLYLIYRTRQEGR